MNIFNKVLGWLHESIRVRYGNDISLDSIFVEYPNNPSHGELATNAAMVLAKRLKKSPIEIANTLLQDVRLYPDIVKCEAVAGFINMSFSNRFWGVHLQKAIELGKDYGKCNIGHGKKVNIEFVSANPTGPMHIGHSRGAIYGDALSDLLEFVGFDVTREYYINDYGAQIDVLAKSARIRYEQALGRLVEMPEGCYPGEYLISIGKELKELHGDRLLFANQEETHELIKLFVLEKMLALIKEDLSTLGVKHDVFTSERFDIIAHGKNEQAFAILQAKGLIYKGILDAPKGQIDVDWEPREQELFRSSNFGDDTDRPLKKSDGSFTYFASDVAYHLQKIERGFDELIVVLGADHIGYVKRLKAAVKGLSDGKVELDVKINQLVNLLKDGQPYKMSKRAGTFITVGNMIEEVGRDVLRFIMLSRKPDTVLDLDFTKANEQTKENPVFYVQYAHARACSIMRKLEELGISAEEPQLEMLKDEAELALIKQILLFPKIVESAALAHEPHRITFYLSDLANCFHSLWSKGTNDESLRFIIEDNVPLTIARTTLIAAARRTISLGLGILKVAALESM